MIWPFSYFERRRERKRRDAEIDLEIKLEEAMPWKKYGYKEPKTADGKALLEAVKADMERSMTRSIVEEMQRANAANARVMEAAAARQQQFNATLRDNMLIPNMEPAIVMSPSAYGALNKWMGTSEVQEIYGVTIRTDPSVPSDRAIVIGDVRPGNDAPNNALRMIAQMYDEEGKLRPVRGDVLDMRRKYDNDLPPIQEGHIDVTHLFEEEG